MTTAIPRRIKTGLAGLAVAGLVTALAACGSSGTPTSTPSGSAPAGNAVPASVTATVNQYRAQPQLNLQPLAAKPAPGKTVAFMLDTNAPTVAKVAQAFTAGAALLGWKTVLINYGGDPATLGTAIQQAVADKVDAIAEAGTDPAQLPNAIKAADSAGIPVFVGGVASVPTGISAGGVSGVVLGEKYLLTTGKISADWVINDSKASAHILTVTLADFPTLQTEGQGFSEELAAQCPKCTNKVINAQITDIGKALPASVVTALQADPSIQYLYFPYGDMSIGVPAALKAAGLSPKLLTAVASDLTYADMKAGRSVMTTTLSPEVQGWLSVDLIAHYFADNKPYANDATIPVQIFDATNASAATLPVAPTNYEAQFKAAWKVQ